MADKRISAAGILFILAVLAGSVLPARSCGPDLPDAVFISIRGPDNADSFAAGRLGILQPTYYQRYLYLAYRNLTKRPLAGEDRAAALRYPASSFYTGEGWSKRWSTTRDSLLAGEGEATYISFDCSRQEGDHYYYYPNYYDDAFHAAERTLLDRVRRQGSADAAVRDWIAAQDVVFSACKEGAAPPAAAPDGAPEWLVKDRAYQKAAWSFYAGRFDDAIAGFQAISEDRASPWSELAPYLVARGYVRKGTVTPDYRKLDEESLRRAEKQLGSVLADPRLAGVHGAARRLLEFVRFRLYPGDRLAKLGHSLLQDHPGADLDQQVFDFTILLDRFQTAQVESLAASNPDYELADWILSFQARDLPHAMERWHASRSTPWLVAAMASATWPAPEADELLAAAARVGPNDPAFASLAFHRARLLAESGSLDAARRLLDSLPGGDRGPFPPSSWNLVLALRTRMARDFDEFLTVAQRVPVEISGEAWDAASQPSSSASYLDADGALILNRWAPLAKSVQAAVGLRLAPELRGPMTLAAWTRAILLDDHDLGVRLAAPLARAYPELEPLLIGYTAAKDGVERRFAATWLLLHAPGASPWIRSSVGRVSAVTERDVFRDNWWCVEGDVQKAWYVGARTGYPPGPSSWTDFAGWDTKLAATILTSVERADAEHELDLLVKAGPGPNSLCSRTLEWASSHPRDPRLPEALHLAVMATRYGCVDQQTTQWSQRAFRVLQGRYAESPWAKKTKYWY